MLWNDRSAFGTSSAQTRYGDGAFIDIVTAALEDHALAMRIAHDAAARIRLDLEPLVTEVARRMRDAGHRCPSIAADEIAGDLVDGVWEAENLSQACARALAGVHEQYLEQAVCVTETARLLEQEGRGRGSRAQSRAASPRRSRGMPSRLDALGDPPDGGVCPACGSPFEEAEGRLPDGLQMT